MSTSKQSLILYASHLNRIGGIETFIFNFCKRLSGHYDITFAYDTAEPLSLLKVADHVKTHKLHNEKLTADCLIVATAWGKGPEGRIFAPVQVQMVHADYVAYIEGWNFKYSKLPSTTHHIAVGQHVARQFEIATPYKIDEVIYNLL